MLSWGRGSSRDGVAREIPQRAGADIVDHEAMSRRVRGDEFGEGRGFAESLHDVVAGVHVHQCGRGVADGGLVIADARLVRGADFAQDGAAGLHHFRQSVAAADLHQLSARHNHLAAGGQCGECEQRGAGVVVDDGGGLGAGQLLQQAFHGDDAL